MASDYESQAHALSSLPTSTLEASVSSYALGCMEVMVAQHWYSSALAIVDPLPRTELCFMHSPSMVYMCRLPVCSPVPRRARRRSRWICNGLGLGRAHTQSHVGVASARTQW